jgi:hypothetical protein
MEIKMGEKLIRTIHLGSTKFYQGVIDILEPVQCSWDCRWATGWKIQGWNSSRNNRLVSKMSRPGVVPSQPSMQWVPGVRPAGIKQLWREVDYYHLLLNLRMSGAIPHLPLYAFMCVQGQLFMEVFKTIFVSYKYLELSTSFYA